jgi:hypothetical protein
MFGKVRSITDYMIYNGLLLYYVCIITIIGWTLVGTGILGCV